MTTTSYFESIEQVAEELAAAHYIADRALATVLFLAHRLQKPVFLEGEPGVGKTEVGLVMAAVFNTQLIRLQCYEGLDASTALYEWNYPKQLLHIRLEEQKETGREEIERLIYSSEFLIKRPLLEAILSSNEKAPVLLIDEIDRSDEEFEAFLLEVLSDFQITIPEIGTMKAQKKPMGDLQQDPGCSRCPQETVSLPLDRLSFLRKGVQDCDHPASPDRSKACKTGDPLHAGT